MSRLCLFGGSFDPVHAGHLHIARAAQERCGLNQVIFLPAQCSPFKINQGRLFTDSQRMELLQEATSKLPWARLSDADLSLPAPSWSWRLVELWRQHVPQAELFWLMGTDQWERLPEWKRYGYLTEHLTFIVYHRNQAPEPRPGVRAFFLEGSHPASSSLIRERLKQGADIPEGWMPQRTEQMARRFLAGA